MNENKNDSLEPTSNKNPEKEKATYTEKTERLKALTQVFKVVSPFIWGIVILVVIIPLLGNFILSKSINTPHPLPSLTSTVTVTSPPNLSKVDRAVKDAIEQAHASAEAYASQELDKWETELISRVDNSFLNWYFDYFNQKKMEFSVPFEFLISAATNKFDMSATNQAIAEKVTEDFQKEFAKRVLVPKEAQMKLENLTTEIINLYLSELNLNLDKVQSSYKIPQGQWDRYLNDLAVTVKDTEGLISNLSLKVLVGGSSYLAAKTLIVVVGKVGSKITTKLAGKAAAKIAAKTGGTVASQLGGFIDPIVGIGIVIWDLWDYHHTVQVERPILRENILNYLADIKTSLLKNPETGIMSTIYQVENGILNSLQSASYSG